MTRYYYRPWKDESLVSALHFMRCRIVREGKPGLEHVDALLGQLGVDPETLPIPQKIDKRFKRNELRRAILSTLREGPQTGAQIAEKVGYGLPPKAAYKRTYIALSAMKKAGLVRHEGRLWLAR
ncbi:MAG: winged helix-turn-helix transcriptional regulator [Mameliella sp.]|nr:winged helix-turn-helix transcriptional regulator [Mameliella sp.]